MTSARRTSKVSIVKETIRHIRQQRDICIAAANDLQTLLAEHNRLVLEVNTLRSQIGGAILEPMLATEAMAQLMDIKDSACDGSPHEISEYWAYDSPKSGKDSSGGAPMNHRTTKLRAINSHPATTDLDHPQLSLQEYPLTTEGDLYRDHWMSGSDAHNPWDISLSLEREFESSQTSYSGLPMLVDDPVLEHYAGSVGQDWFARETTATHANHLMQYPERYLDSINSTHYMQRQYVELPG